MLDKMTLLRVVLAGTTAIAFACSGDGEENNNNNNTGPCADVPGFTPDLTSALENCGFSDITTSAPPARPAKAAAAPRRPAPTRSPAAKW